MFEGHRHLQALFSADSAVDTLRFTYRYAQWQYWNHSHLVKLLRDRARAQRVPKKVLGRVVGAISRAALDVSFRRSGGLFVVLHNRKHLREIARPGDALAGADRTDADVAFGNVVDTKTIQSLPRSVLAELASLDGAVVLQNSGTLVAYGAVLQPKKSGKLHGTEGSRTKAAIGTNGYLMDDPCEMALESGSPANKPPKEEPR
jgi:DNA integrity scanning protein DisA with diadenylate cyclase activity